MTIGSKEHYELLEAFEKAFKAFRLDKENKDLWSKGHVYQSGEVNNMYKAFILGYSTGRAVYIN